MKNFILITVLAIAALAGAIWWSKSLQSSDPSIIAKNGIHWHPELTILVKGEKQVIPVNIGIGPEFTSKPGFEPRTGMTQIHTHEDADRGIIHLEFSGIVREEDIILGQFLKILGKDLNSFGSNVKMTVNGVDNTELENYIMQDKDKIVLSYD